MNRKLWTRAARMAKSDPNRRLVWDFLRRDHTATLVTAADLGAVPVTAISTALLERFGAEVLDPPSMRQFIGIAVSAILQEEGFIVDRTGVRLRGDPLFGAGALFERAGVAPVERENSLLARLIDALDAEELRFAERRIGERLMNLPRQESPVEEDNGE